MNAPYVGRAQPTPGPWTATEPNGPGMGWRVGPAWLGIDPRSEQTAADARLITSAPDLLTALINLERTARIAALNDDPARMAARFAIASATGSAT